MLEEEQGIRMDYLEMTRPGGGGERRYGSSSSSSGTRCQDCGNQAKKDCGYMRCRTCCNSKGFQCQTHVKSTWIPAHRRRQRLLQHQPPQQLQLQQPHQQLQLQQQPPPPPPPPPPVHQHHPFLLNQNPKRHRDSSNRPTRLLFQEDLPPEVSSHATFKCVTVTSMEDGSEGDRPEYAYQTSVSIRGHLFKGILYDQGPDHGTRTAETGERAPPRVDNLPRGIASTSSSAAGAASNQAPVEQMYLCPYPFPFASSIIHGSHIFPPPKS